MLRAMIRGIAFIVLLLLAAACGTAPPQAEPTDEAVAEQSSPEPPPATMSPAPTEADTGEACALLKDVDRQDRRTDEVLRRTIAPIQKAKTPAEAREAFAAFLVEMKRYATMAVDEARPTYEALAEAVPQRLKADVIAIWKFSESYLGDFARVRTPQDLVELQTAHQSKVKELDTASQRLDEFSVETCGFSIAS
jgi:flagellar biosynthesis regulator FlaF